LDLNCLKDQAILASIRDTIEKIEKGEIDVTRPGGIPEA